MSEVAFGAGGSVARAALSGDLGCEEPGMESCLVGAPTPSEFPLFHDPDRALDSRYESPSAPGAMTALGMEQIPARLSGIWSVRVRMLDLSEVEEPRTTWKR